MTTPVAVGFTIGVLAALASCALPFALAAVGLRAARPGRARGGLRGAIGGAVATGALAGLAFAAVVVVALALEEAGVEISDAVAVPALAAAIAVVAFAIGALVRGGETPPPSREPARRRRVAAIWGAAYGVISLPGSLWLIQGGVDLTAESRGTAGAVASVVLFCAGAFAIATVIALLAELAAAGARRLGAAGRVLGAAIAAAAGGIAALYWLPAVVDGIAERGGATGDEIGEVAAALGWFAATNGIVFALVLLGAAALALAAEIRRPAQP